MDPNESGDQPMHNADGTISWVVNGETYNFAQLRDEHGLDCKTTSDLEVAGLLYEKYGRAVKLLDGMFSSRSWTQGRRARMAAGTTWEYLPCTSVTARTGPLGSPAR